MKSSEIFENGNFNEGPDIPEENYRHCMVKINSTHVVLTGGVSYNGLVVSSQILMKSVGIRS